MVEKKIIQEIIDLKSIQTLVQTYEEIAASRMQRVKSSVLTTREFLAGLGEIFAQVQYSYEREIAKLRNQAKRAEEEAILSRNGKTVSVLLSANTGLYGDIVRQTFEKFLKGIINTKTDIVVVGRVGRGMFEASKPSVEGDYKYFDLPDSPATAEDFKKIIEHIVQYEKVVVYHGQFESILSQVPVGESLTGKLAVEQEAAVEEQLYIFEPSLPVVISFFETQILASIFEQSVHESNLSKFASRMINLDRAVVNVGNRITKTDFKRQRAHHHSINKKQRDVLSSMALWE